MTWIDATATVVQAVAVTIAAGAATLGLTTWRRELTARRRAELAEQTLAMFYEARDLLAWVLSPAGYHGEGSSRQRGPKETEDETNYKNALYAPIERLSHQAEFWGRFEASRYAFMAVFGEEASKPFDSIRQMKIRVEISAKMLMRTYGRVNERREDLQRQHEKWERDIGWRVDEESDAMRQIEEAIAAIEETCKPAITVRR